MRRHVDDVIGATHNEQVAFVVKVAPVASQVVPRILRQVALICGDSTRQKWKTASNDMTSHVRTNSVNILTINSIGIV